MLVGKLRANDDAALHQGILFGNTVPFCGHIDHLFQIFVLAHCNGYHRFRQNRDVNLSCRNGGTQISRLCIGVVNGNIQSILGKQILHDESRILRRAIYGLAVQVCKRADALIPVGHNIQYAEGVCGKNLHAPFGLGIHRRRRIGRQCGNINISGDQSRRNIGSIAFDGKRIIEQGILFGILIHQLCHAESGCAVEYHNFDIQPKISRSGCFFRRSGLLRRSRAVGIGCIRSFGIGGCAFIAFVGGRYRSGLLRIGGCGLLRLSLIGSTGNKECKQHADS